MECPLLPDPAFSRRAALGTVVGISIAPMLFRHLLREGPADVRRFGAKGDGKQDDTPAFLKALATGRDLYIPATTAYYKISRTLGLSRPGQCISGDGIGSHVVQMGHEGDGSVFVTQHDDCCFEGLHLTPNTTVIDLTHGWGVLVTRARNCRIVGCRVSGMRRGGVALSDANDCEVSDNVFVESVVRGDGTEPQAVTGYDVYLMGNSSSNVVKRNQCLSGCGVGIGCQTAVPDKYQTGNVVSDNVVKWHPCYGIMVYGSEVGFGIENFRIENNIIEAISGAMRTDGKTRFYGCGIYVASSNHFTIVNNRVKDTNTDRRMPFSVSAVPAGIGVSGFGDGLIAGNVIDGCYNGIASIQATVPGSQEDRTEIRDNTIRRCTKHGIYLLDTIGANIAGNDLEGLGNAWPGVYSARAIARHAGDVTISGNVIGRFAIGIEVRENTPLARIDRNQVSGNTGAGVYTGARTSQIQNNEIDGERGIILAPEVLGGFCRGNIVRRGTLPVENHSAGNVTLGGNRSAE